MPVILDSTVVIEGVGEEDVNATVEWDESPVQIQGLVAKDVGFKVSHGLNRPVTFSELTIEKSGPAAGKCTTALLLNAFTVQPGAQVANSLRVEPTEFMGAGDTVTVRLQGRSD